MANQYLHTLSDTWNSAMTKFFGIRMNVTDTNSDVDSRVLEMQVGGSPVFSVRRDGRIFGVDGTAGAPTYAFESDKNTGIYRISGDILAFATAGTERARVGASGFQIVGPVTGDAVVSSDSDVTAGRLLKTAPGPAQAFRRGNILGTVSQSGGVPTGAVIETGSNANGDYVRFANKTQICWNNILIKPASDATTGNKSVVWTYPAAFSNALASSATASLINTNPTARTGPTTGNYTTTTVTLYYAENAGVASDVSARVVAIGPWF